MPPDNPAYRMHLEVRGESGQQVEVRLQGPPYAVSAFVMAYQAWEQAPAKPAPLSNPQETGSASRQKHQHSDERAKTPLRHESDRHQGLDPARRAIFFFVVLPIVAAVSR